MTRPVTVSIYDTTGAMVRYRGGAVRNNVRRLRFSSGLPGGFLACSFDLALFTARHWPVEVGYTVIVRLGQTIVWWGWVEDIQRRQRGQLEWLAVQALGPWQQVNERLITRSYDDVVSTYIVRDMLIAYCPAISADYSQLENSGTPLTIDWTNKRLTELVKTTCAAGNASGQTMMFAIWEPPGSRVSVGATGTLNEDPELEHNETYWEPTGTLLEYRTSPYVSPGHSWRWLDSASTNLRTKDRIAVTAGLTYEVDYQVYWTAYAGMQGSSRIDWYNALNAFISTTYGATWTSDGTTTGWQARSETHVAPALAVEAVLHVGATVGSGGGTARYVAIDDVRMYLYTATLAPDTKPRAYLWSRDLSDYDYSVRTAALRDALQTTTTTRDLANYVVASYGSSSFTAAAEDATSQAAYRQRDALISAGSVIQADAEAQRDAYLALHKDPGVEVGQLRLTQGSVLDRLGLAVHPCRLRAGDRLRVADGALAGTVFLLERVEYDAESGVATASPESYTDVSRILAQV
jgi:hypothetical protein